MRTRDLRNYPHKKWLFIGATILTFSNILGAPVSKEEAITEAAAFLSNSATGIRRAPTPEQSLNLAITYQKDGIDCFHIFNSADNRFVIVSADDRLNPILGYSDAGNFDPDRIPENMKWWLNEYVGEITSILPTMPEDGGKTGKIKRAPAREAILPMLTTKWDQGTPFNNDCPTDRSGQKSVTGCVATAVSQIMKFHVWPLRPSGSSGGINFSGTTYDWDNMIDVYESGHYTSAQASAVAKLMRQVGAAVEMQYSSYGSGAYDFNVQLALPKYFNYSKGLTMNFKDYTPANKWSQLIYDELAAGRPVYYSGASNEGGHAFVCDGYSPNDFFHFNWGWGGYEDGYFMLSALNPAAGGAGSYEGGYNRSQTVITGIMKAELDPDAKTQLIMLSTGGLYYDNQMNSFMVMQDPNGFNLIYNPTGYVQSVNIAIRIQNSSNPEDIRFVDCGNMDLAPSFGFPGVKAELPSDIPDGDYKITLVFDDDNNYDDSQEVLIPLGYQNYVAMNAKNGVYSYQNLGPDVDFEPKLIIGFPTSTPIIWGNAPIAFNLPILNVGNGDFSGQIGFSLFNVDDEFGDIGSFMDYVSVPGNSFVNLEVIFRENLSPGRYRISVVDLDDNTFIDNQFVTIAESNFKQPTDVNLTVTDLAPCFYTSGMKSPVYFTAKNNLAEELDVKIRLEILDNISLKRVKILDREISGILTAYQSTRANITPFNFDLQPGYYMWRLIDNDEKPLSLPTPLIVSSEVIEEDGYAYIITNHTARTAMLTSPSDYAYSGDFTIPEYIGDYKIKALRNDAFTFSNVTDLTIPASISYIPTGEFYNVKSLKNIYLPYASEKLLWAQPNAFNPEFAANTWVNADPSTANIYQNMSVFWRLSYSNWKFRLDDCEITSGVEINPESGEIYNPCCFDPESQPEITLSTPAGKNISYVGMIDGEVVVGATIDPALTTIILPKLGEHHYGWLHAWATDDEVGISTVADDSGEYTRYYDLSGNRILNPSKGIFIRIIGSKAEKIIID